MGDDMYSKLQIFEPIQEARPLLSAYSLMLGTGAVVVVTIARLDRKIATAR